MQSLCAVPVPPFESASIRLLISGRYRSRYARAARTFRSTWYAAARAAAAEPAATDRPGARRAPHLRAHATDGDGLGRRLAARDAAVVRVVRPRGVAQLAAPEPPDVGPRVRVPGRPVRGHRARLRGA